MGDWYKVYDSKMFYLRGFVKLFNVMSVVKPHIKSKEMFLAKILKQRFSSH